MSITLAAVLAVFIAAGLMWAGHKLRQGPGPDSRLERLLRDHPVGCICTSCREFTAHVNGAFVFSAEAADGDDAA